MSLTAQSALPLQKEGVDRKKLQVPIDAYYKGNGEAVQKSMEKTYGPEKAKQVFYATANKSGMKPGDKRNKPKGIGTRLAEMAGKKGA